MTATAVKQKPLGGIGVPIVAALTVAGIGIAPRAVKDNPLALLHDVVAFVSTSNIGGGFSRGECRRACAVPGWRRQWGLRLCIFGGSGLASIAVFPAAGTARAYA